MEEQITVVDLAKQDAIAVEYIDIYVPIVRYSEGNYWSTFGLYNSLSEATSALRSCTGLLEAKILHHVERFK